MAILAARSELYERARRKQPGMIAARTESVPDHGGHAEPGARCGRRRGAPEQRYSAKGYMTEATTTLTRAKTGQVTITKGHSLPAAEQLSGLATR